MSITSSFSPRFASGDLSTSGTKPSEQTRRRSHRLSLANWKSNGASECSITHVDVFLGSLTAISEQLAASLAENARQRGAEVTMRSIETFRPEQYLDPNSILRSTSRLTVFVVSTHVAGKPSPNAEGFLQWLREASATEYPPAVDPLQSGDTHVSEESRKMDASAPQKNNSPSTSPRRLQISPSKSDAELHRHHSLTDALRASFRVTWRLPFGGGEAAATANKSDGPLQGLQYAVFGVGNSIYRTYNATAKFVDSRLHELGATRIYPVGLGDVSKGIEAVFSKWEVQLLHTISPQPSNPSTRAPVTAREPSMSTSRASLPCVTANAGINIAQTLAMQPVIPGPIPTDMESPRPRRYGEKPYQKRYTYNNATSPITRRVTLTSTSMPPLTDRK